MGDLNLNPGPDQMIQNFVGVSSQAVRLCSVQVNVTKSFLTSTSNVITIPAPTGLTITNLISCAAAIFPGTIQVVDVAGTLEVQFNASIFFTVQLHNNNVILLSDTITVQGVLGPTSEVKVTSGGCTVPTLSCINSSIGPGGASISGQIQVGPFTCETCQLKSVKVVLDPDVPDPVGPPIDP